MYVVRATRMLSVEILVEILNVFAEVDTTVMANFVKILTNAKTPILAKPTNFAETLRDRTIVHVTRGTK